MAKNLTDAIKSIQDLALGLGSGDIKAAPDAPIESINVFPFCMTYPASGTLNREQAGVKRDIHTIFSEVHINPVNLGPSVEKMMSVLEEYALALQQNPTLTDTSDAITVDTIVYPIRYSFGSLRWAEEEHLGFRFEIDVKIRNSLST